MLPIIIATVIGGVIVALMTRPGAVFDSPGAAGGGATGRPSVFDEQGSVTVGSIGASPYSQGTSRVGMGIQSAGLGTSLAGSGAFGGTVAASAAVPIIGAGIAVVAAIFGIMAKHHAEAVAREAQILNSAAPHFRNGLTQLCSAAVQGQVTQDQFNQFLDQLIGDYYTEVKQIIKGHWPGSAGGTPPDPCNGPCVVGHWWIEKDTLQLRNLVTRILKKEHGTINLNAIPAHAGFQGAPSITITY